MKRKFRINKILFPQIILTASIPFFSLASCQETTPKTFNVQFDTQGGSFIKTIKVEENQIVTQPQNPQKENADFVGWYQDLLFITPFDFNKPITQDTTIFALWDSIGQSYNLDFSTDGHGELSSTIMTDVPDGTQWCDLIHDPLFPTISPLDGYRFRGWYLDDYKLENDSTAIITKPWSIIARFDPPKPIWTISFVAGDNGTLVDNEPANVIDGSTWSQLVHSHQMPTPCGETGYAFDGWYKNEVRLNDDDQMQITYSFVVYAKFKPNPAEPYKITLLNHPEDGFVLTTQEVVPGRDLNVDIISLFELKKEDIKLILCDGKPITDYTFTPSPKYNNRVTIFVPASEIKGDINIGIAPPVAPIPHNFETDDWSTVLYYINRGAGAVMNAYHKSNIENFLGLKRKITMNNVEHYVQIVGINNDFVDSEHTKPVLFTFQFDNLISSRNGNGLLINWHKNTEVGNKNYWRSILENALNGTNVDWINDNVNHNSVIEMIEYENMALYSHIKTIDRSVNVYDQENANDSQYILSHMKTKIFCLNLANVFSQTGINNTSTDIIPEAHKEMYINEASQYLYYQNLINDHVVDDTKFETLIKKEAKTTDPLEMSYWFTSPNLSDFNHVYRINQFGEFGISDILNDYAVAPCFAI